MLGKVPGMPQAATEHEPQVRRDELPLADRSMELRSFQRAADGEGKAPLATAELIFTTGAPVKRYDWYRERFYLEELAVEEGAIRLDRLQRGAPLLNTHDSWDLEAVLGVVQEPTIAAGQGTCRVAFSRRESVAGYVQDVEDRVIRNVSVGYVRHKVEMIPPVEANGLWRYRAVDWEPYEVSLVPIPADAGSQVRAAGDRQPAEGRDTRTFPCDFIEVRSPSSAHGGHTAATSTPKGSTMTPEEIEAKRVADAAAAEASKRAAEQAAAVEAARVAEQTRGAEITELCRTHNLPQLATEMIRGGVTLEAARAKVLDELARRSAGQGGERNVRIETVSDEMALRLAGIEQAITHRIMAATQLDDNGRRFRGMSLLEMGRGFLEAHGVDTRGMDRMTLAGRMLHFRAPGAMGTSDFASLFANVANKRLRNAYEENPGTYARWARRAPNAPDFKSMQVTVLSGAPDLLQVNEAGEFKYGTLSDGKETYALTTFGRIVALTRQAIINDDLRAFDRLVSGFGGSAARLENRSVYAILTANAALGDAVALFHATHGNLATGGGSVLAAAGLKAGRTAMRLQKGLQNEELNLAPAYLIVPAALEQDAYQLTSSNYVPATKAEVNEFRQGGRTAVEPIVESVLDANSSTAWYLAASNSAVDTVEYCYLDGAEGPQIEDHVGFDVDGVQLKCRLDFAAKAIDHRGIYKAAGA